ncbi:ABC transporter permease [Filomicrobium sp.]|uniref:MlaE family ABC transporter permease n=1 Tax=Filomicrobium sp. TaxID=2024831 RepID=UPI0025910C49|nr:ABC transporter permease [Filomicrobium sp.]MCV0369070.1 ABC transporter permease [Filomicrobium sp.]
MDSALVSSSSPTLTFSRREGRVVFVAAGNWTAAYADALEDLVEGASARIAEEPLSALDLNAVAELDTFGAVFLERLRHQGGRLEKNIPVNGLAERLRPLFEEVDSSIVAPQAVNVRGNALVDYLSNVGRAITGIWSDLVALAAMLGAICASVWRIVLHPLRFRLTSAVHHLDRVGWQAVPIILLITFLIGGIIAQQGIFHFRKFGADVYVVDMVGILVLREIGVLIVAIMVAGRSGSSYTAELGSMKMREEIDALETMGLDPVEVLVLPRVVALVIALPILTFLGSMSALYGAQLVAWLYGGMSPEIFLTRLKEAISITHFKVGMIKAPFMALVIGIVACAQGLQVKGSAESLGLQTTASVVKAIFLVIVLDGLFAIFFASIDM